VNRHGNAVLLVHFLNKREQKLTRFSEKLLKINSLRNSNATRSYRRSVNVVLKLQQRVRSRDLETQRSLFGVLMET